MPSKDFKSAMNKQRTNPVGTGQGRLGVVGDVPNPVREELERNAQDLPEQQIEIDLLHDNPFQELARPIMDEGALEELTSYIKANGFYGALLARRRRGAPGYYELAYGHRRREAAHRAGLTYLPVKVLDLNDTQMAQIMASENFSREDLTPLGEANIIGYLYTSQNMSQDEVAGVVGKTRGWVQNRIQLYEAPQDVKDFVEQHPESFSFVRVLVKVSEEAQRKALIKEALEKRYTFEQLKERVAQQKPGKIDTKITNRNTATDGEINNNVSREISWETEPGLERDPTLRRLDRLVAKVELFVENRNFQLAQDEISYLSEIVDRLNNLLDKLS